jgi:ArsR family transcriptional regulator
MTEVSEVSMPGLEMAINPKVVQGFRALSDPLRLEILQHLRQQELCVCDLCDRIQVSQSKLSFHLKTLKDAELVKSRQQGRWIYYRLCLSQLAVMEEYLAEIRQFSPRLPSRRCGE